MLSGVLDDGTAGLWALKRSGGIAVVQAFDDAMFPDMPRNAAAHITVDHIATAAEIGPLLNRLVAQAPRVGRAGRVATELMRIENDYARLKDVPRAVIEEFGKPSSLICPICNGPLWEINEGPRRFRCHTGHAFTPNSLVEEHRKLSDRTLAVLMTLFDDEVTLSKHMLETNVDPDQAPQIRRDVRECARRAAVLRQLLPGQAAQRRSLPAAADVVAIS